MNRNQNTNMTILLSSYHHKTKQVSHSADSLLHIIIQRAEVKIMLIRLKNQAFVCPVPSLTKAASLAYNA